VQARVFVPNMQALGLDVTRPYELRHAYASLLAHEGRSVVVYIAKQLGHGATVSLGVYQHVIDELEDRPALAAKTRSVERVQSAKRCVARAERALMCVRWCVSDG
jgi:hypothetical protein